ncbi:MAG: hypothetical protein JRE23_08785 [Deltaproteobacteria bacterium]|nr:hypothetical protein [Deltaproteobacteria bacterium]
MKKIVRIAIATKGGLRFGYEKIVMIPETKDKEVSVIADIIPLYTIPIIKRIDTYA